MNKCPNCGAPLEGSKCEYCQHVVPKESAQDSNEVSKSTININIASPNTQQEKPRSNSSHYNPYYNPYKSSKSKATALLLCIFLGYIGVHRFYVGKAGSGVLYLFTGGLLGIGWFVDIFTIIGGSFKDNYGKQLS